MQRLSGWWGGKAAEASSEQFNEPEALAEAMKSTMLAMNDEVEKAESELSEGTTPFHKLGRGATLFLRAGLGFEKEIMEKAVVRLAESEESATEHLKRARRDPSSVHQSAIYPIGAEFALCQAESQLMFAVMAILNQNFTESLRGMYKIKKAFSTLHELHEAEKKYLRTHHSASSRSSLMRGSATSASEATTSSFRTPATNGGDDDFVDVEEKNAAKPAVNPAELPDLTKLNVQAALNPDGSAAKAPTAAAVTTTPEALDEELDFRTITSDPIDLYIHSGTSMAFGLIQLVLSFLPSAFARILALFSFHGDRDEAINMLWSATRFRKDINGAIAGLSILSLNSAVAATFDITPPNAMAGRRRKALIRDLRTMYPKSMLWLLEEARGLTFDREIERAVELQGRESSPLKQLEALCVFERSVNLMFLHRYEEAAISFLKCLKLNDWSHASYYYHAAACYVELYRTHKVSDPTKAEDYAEKADKYMHEVLKQAGKTKIMGQKLPFDVFCLRKLAKWDHRTKVRNCSFIDAIGISPVEEMIYFWNGFMRMNPTQLSDSQACLAWSDDKIAQEPADEKAMLAVLRGTVLRFQGETQKAKTLLREDVLCFDTYQLKACDHPDIWVLPVGHYELAVCLWEGCGGDKVELRQCREELSKVAQFGRFDMDAGVELKVRVGLETVEKIVGKN